MGTSAHFGPGLTPHALMHDSPHRHRKATLRGSSTWHFRVLEKPRDRRSPAPERDPGNELYDEACSLLQAAQGLPAAADPRTSSRTSSGPIYDLVTLFVVVGTPVAVWAQP